VHPPQSSGTLLLSPPPQPLLISISLLLPLFALSIVLCCAPTRASEPPQRLRTSPDPAESSSHHPLPTNHLQAPFTPVFTVAANVQLINRQPLSPVALVEAVRFASSRRSHRPARPLINQVTQRCSASYLSHTCSRLLVLTTTLPQYLLVTSIHALLAAVFSLDARSIYSSCPNPHPRRL